MAAVESRDFGNLKAHAGKRIVFEPLTLTSLSLLACLVGIVTGFGAVLFRDLIGFVHNLMFLGQISVTYDANLFTPPSPWGALVILVPVVGGIGVTFLVANFAPEAKGHGVPEVMDAIYYKSGIIRPVVAVVKSLASALAIGSGAAVGREGPIIQIGSALGSSLGQIIRMTPAQRITLVAAGAGAGIAATFNTPIGGVMFAIELMLPEVSVSTFLPVALATGTATFLGRLFFGPAPAFVVPPLDVLPNDPSAAVTLLLYAVLGALIGVAATLFIRSLHWAEDLFDRIPGRYTRHIIGMLLVGLLLYGLQQRFGQYYVDGVGYATVQAILQSQLSAGLLLALLFAAKLAATSLSLGSGSSGGIFSPSLYMGATLGGAFAGVAGFFAPGLGINIPAFAMVGMGAMVGGGTGAVMTAVTMTFEMTRDYGVVMPMIIAVALSVGVRRMLLRENIYTFKLLRRGHAIPKALQANMFLVRRAKEVMESDIAIVPPGLRFDEFLCRPDNAGRMRHILVAHDNRLVGVLRVNTALRHGLAGIERGMTLGELAQRNFVIAREGDVMFDVISRLYRKGAAMAVVVRGSGVPRLAAVLGLITKEHIADAVAESVSVYPR